MKIKLKPFSRLTIIFILAVTIPGSILSYLSIRNITNLQELTERRILEEEEDLADLIYQKFQGKLSDICEEFEDYVSKTDEGDYASIRFSDTIDLIENPFIIDQEGEFLFHGVSAKKPWRDGHGMVHISEPVRFQNPGLA